MSRPAVFLDRDKTIIADPGYIADPRQVSLLPGAAEAIRRWNAAGFAVVVVTNQSGVARGLLTEERLAEIHQRLRDLLQADGARLDAIYYCPFLDGPEAVVERYRMDSELRKPKPGMLRLAAQDLGLDLSRSWMIGDSRHDVTAGAAAGCRTILIDPAGRSAPRGEPPPTCVAGGILEAAQLTSDADRRTSERILIVMPSWVGDAVMATPALRAIRARFPAARISLLIRPSIRDVVADGPWFDDLLEWPPDRPGWRRLMDLWAAAQRIRRGRFHRAVLLPNSFRAALAVWLGGVPRRLGYDRDGRGFLLTDRLLPKRDGRKFALVSTVHYYNELAIRLGCEPPGERFVLGVSPADAATVQARLHGWQVADHHPLVVINPGVSFGPSKLWPPERFAAVADRLVNEFDARVVVTCGPGEEALAWRIHDAMAHPPLVVDRPRGTLGQLKALIRRCDLLLTNDTGPRHFAKAFGRPVVTVFGSTFPEWTHTDYPPERIVRVPVDCGPCQLKVCPLDHRCMTGVTVDLVFQAASGLLRAQAVGAFLPVVS